MNVFKRTKAGLENQHLFYNVDLVVYLEGGSTSFTKTEVYAGEFNDKTKDIIFWRNMFNKFKSDKKVKFKSVGSKDVIIEIADDIVKDNLSHVFVAMDNEFDEILNQRIEHPNVYYTHGYSWENDAWNHHVAIGVIEGFSGVEIDNNDIEVNFKNFLKKMKLAVCADGYLFKKNSSFFPRSGGLMFCIDCTSVELPIVKTPEIKKRITEKGLKVGTLYAFGCRHSLEVSKFCFGHLLSAYCCKLITNYLRKEHSLKSIPHEIIHRMGLGKFFEISFSEGDTYDYFKRQFERG